LLLCLIGIRPPCVIQDRITKRRGTTSLARAQNNPVSVRTIDPRNAVEPSRQDIAVALQS
jgi:hypothetical protein